MHDIIKEVFDISWKKQSFPNRLQMVGFVDESDGGGIFQGVHPHFLVDSFILHSNSHDD